MEKDPLFKGDLNSALCRSFNTESGACDSESLNTDFIQFMMVARGAMTREGAYLCTACLRHDTFDGIAADQRRCPAYKSRKVVA